MARELWKGNEALAEAAIRAGVEAFFGYPITPQTELLEYMARRMPELGRAFLQAESEIGAIHMVYGAACAGKRAMTSSSSPGISLMQEGLSYIAGSEVPCVLVDIMRGGPGLGNIQPSQSDYFQVTRSAGHGDFHPIVLAPSTVQEAVDLMVISFDLAFRYRTLVVVAADGTLGQIMEPVEMPPFVANGAEQPDWALGSPQPHAQRIITSLLSGCREAGGRQPASTGKAAPDRGCRTALGNVPDRRRRPSHRGVWDDGTNGQVGHPDHARGRSESGPVAAHHAVALSRCGLCAMLRHACRGSWSWR